LLVIIPDEPRSGAMRNLEIVARDSRLRHSGMVRKHQTRNLEVPGSMLRIAPE